jgi:chaperonin cofactor prefoldin
METKETELNNQIDAIKGEIIEKLDALTPREVSDFTIKLAVLIDSLAGILAVKEQEYAAQWVENNTISKTAREADMLTRAADVYKERMELINRMRALTELVNALKKRNGVLELETKNQN